MATVVGRMSLEEFLAQPGETYHDFRELHNGEIVEVPAPTVEHLDTQVRLEQLLNERCSTAGYTARREFYMTLPTEARRVDVAMISNERLHAQRTKVFFGSPELVIEVLSPSDLHMDIDHLREACFKDECREFWVINREFQTVTTYRRGRVVNIHAPGECVPLDTFGLSSSIPVSEIFEPTEQ
jgi:Uma2 family endonuclease